jgi:hypothetical protein
MGAFQEIKEYHVLHEYDGFNISIVLRKGASGEEVAMLERTENKD